HDPVSELARVNSSAATESQPVSAHFRTVLRCALDVAARSAGAFDPTVGGDLAARGFLPLRTACDRTAAWRDVVLDEEGVSFKRPLILDFDGIAKGYAVDCAVDVLRNAGVEQAVVNAGGDLRVYGPDVEQVEWRTSGVQNA